MVEINSTPGPWKATPIGQGTGDFCIHARGIPWQLAYLSENSLHQWPIEANARLIAAAPELLEALASLHAFVGVMVGHGPEAAVPETIATPLGVPVKIGDIVRDAAAAIAKATGQTP